MFRQLVLARVIEPASKQDSLRVLEEAGTDAVPYAASMVSRRARRPFQTWDVALSDRGLLVDTGR